MSGSTDTDLERRERRFSATEGGSDVHCAVRLAADDDQGRERLVRYFARPPLALDRNEVRRDGRIAWLRGEPALQQALAEELIAFEAKDDLQRTAPSKDRFAGEWALVTHQMTALGLAQLCLADPALTPRDAPVITRAATKSFLPEMRDFGTRAWAGEDALASLAGPHGHAYLAYPALAVGMALEHRGAPPTCDVVGKAPSLPPEHR